jgi:hypothetical protein
LSFLAEMGLLVAVGRADMAGRGGADDDAGRAVAVERGEEEEEEEQATLRSRSKTEKTPSSSRVSSSSLPFVSLETGGRWFFHFLEGC